MSDGSRIEWTQATWNPVTGCTRVSSGCEHCYIERTPPLRMAHRRFDKPGVGGTTGVTLHPDRLGQPYRWRKPRRVFVCSLADLFHDDVPDDYLVDVWSLMATNQRHTFQVLTKRPARMHALLSRPDFREKVARRGAALMEDGDNWFDYLLFDPKMWPLPNVWGGVTAEDQPAAERRISILMDTPLAVRWVSAEPLLGPISLHIATSGTFPSIDWLVAGGESGPKARPMRPDWARDLRDQCQAARVPFFFKQWGEFVPPSQMPDDTFRSWEQGGGQIDERDTPRRVGKKAAGRLLDDVIHDEYPTAGAR